MATLIVGAGKWGCTIAKRMNHLGYPVDMLDPARKSEYDPNGRPILEDIDGWASCLTSAIRYARVIIATPPHTHEALFKAVTAAGVRRVRIEKPCGTSTLDAECIATHAQDTATKVAVGYQMLDSKAWRMLRVWANTTEIEDIEIIRTSADTCRHNASAMLDLASHGAAYAADLESRRCLPRIVTMHDVANCRTLRLVGAAGIGTLSETPDGAIVTINGARTFIPADNPLDTSLTNWMQNDAGPDAWFAHTVHELLEGRIKPRLKVAA